MNQLLYYASLILLLTNCSGHAQTNAPQSTGGAATPGDTYVYAMPSGKKATLNLPFARNIVVKAWDKPELQFKALIQTTREEMKTIHTYEAEDATDALRITTGFSKELESKKNFTCCWCNTCDSLLNAGRIAGAIAPSDCICFRVDYEIYLPAASPLALESISGDIEIRGLNGELKAKTISGFIDIDRKSNAAAALTFKSVTGEIYTDFDIALDANSSAYSKRLHTALNGGGPGVAAETVSGDIFFRKMK